MLFNSYVFILAFLPVVLAVYYSLGGLGKFNGAVAWLLLASLFFYGWWNPTYLLLIMGSMTFNYVMGGLIAGHAARGSALTRPLLVLGVAVNLGNIAYFKYADFLADNLNAVIDGAVTVGDIVLPLAISFYTFQQITYLVDASRGEGEQHDFLRYCLFVTFFPQLIAGPIVHHKSVMPQFLRPSTFRFSHTNVAVGLTFFVIGLFKKVVLADGIAVYGSPVFDAAAAGQAMTFVEAWGGALAYTLQLYFDFSGYSDMAVGLGWMFGIRLPFNFNSPYKAANIIDFWRRWHMTLSAFLRDYLYIPLGGSRKGVPRRYVNLMITMLLGGLWHGAGWTFIVWGGLHGLYLVVNHGWRRLRALAGYPAEEPSWWGLWVGRLVTLLAVVVGWVFFRAASVDVALRMLTGMAGLNGIVLPVTVGEALPGAATLTALGVTFDEMPLFMGPPQVLLTVFLLVIVLFAPNTQEWVGDPQTIRGRVRSVRSGIARWMPSPGWAAAVATLFIYTLTQLSKVSEFLYFQF